MIQTAKPIGLVLVAAILAALVGVLGFLSLTPALAQANNPATGAPRIEGAVQLDELLVACSWRCIDDADGMTTPNFAYQWIRRDGTTDMDIDGATSGSYTIVAADVGKTLKVEVSFTDDAGNPETLTSGPTATVSSQRNSPTTGLPTISGTAQVGQTLTVDTSGIADADGLTNALYGGNWYANGGYLRVLLPAGSDLSYTVSRRDVGMTLEISVDFRDDAGKFVFLNSAPTELVAPIFPAAPETFVVSENTDGSLDLSWEEPTWDFGGETFGEPTWGDGGSPITGYVVQWKEAADSWGTAADVSEATVTGTSHIITDLTDGDHTIRILAVNNVGRGIPSDEVTVTRETSSSGGDGGNPPPVTGTDDCGEDIGNLTGSVSESGTWADDCVSSVSGRGYARYFSFTLAQGTEATIDLSSGVDAYLYLRQGSATSGRSMESNDDIESGNTDSRIVADLDAGSYTIEATTYSEDTTGSFTLSVSAEGGTQTPVATGCDPASLSLPATGVTGSWADDCESSVSGRGYARYYSFTLAAETEVTIDLESSVDTYLYLRDGSVTSGASVESNDDVLSGNTDSQIVATLSAGTYIIEATTYSEATTGSFTLSVSGGGSGTPSATGCNAASLTLPVSGVSGTWASDCESSVSGRGYARYYSFTLAAETEVTIDLESSVDTYLYLRDGSVTSGASVESNDDVLSGNTDSQIEATLSAGTYIIEATTYAEDTTGSFTLSVSTGNG